MNGNGLKPGIHFMWMAEVGKHG